MPRWFTVYKAGRGESVRCTCVQYQNIPGISSHKYILKFSSMEMFKDTFIYVLL